jgi:hypothetical protein
MFQMWPEHRDASWHLPRPIAEGISSLGSAGQ